MNPLLNLSTPWVLGGGCHVSDPNSAVFVQALILYQGTVKEYTPLVIDEGTTPAIPPVSYSPPQGSIVGIFGGGDDDTTTLTGGGAASCVNGVNGVVFGQVFFCNTHNLLTGILAANIGIPGLGIDSSGAACPSTRSFKIVDQDQSDNVQSTYLVTPGGQSAQDTPANRSALGSFSVAKNGSDNRLLSDFVDPAIGCVSATVPSIESGLMVPTQGMNELQAMLYQGNPIALIPSADPMTGPNNLGLVNAYRYSLLQPTIHSLGQANTQAYCAHMKNTAPAFFNQFKVQFQASASPTSGMNLYDFLVGRFTASLGLLGCH